MNAAVTGDLRMWRRSRVLGLGIRDRVFGGAHSKLGIERGWRLLRGFLKLGGLVSTIL